jgi:mRNA interferase HigB
VRVIARNTLVDFWTANPAAAASLGHWLRLAKSASWSDPAAVLRDFSKAKALNGESVRFEVAGGDFRMIVAFDFPRQIAFIKFVGTHAQYDRVDALTVSQF